MGSFIFPAEVSDILRLNIAVFYPMESLERSWNSIDEGPEVHCTDFAGMLVVVMVLSTIHLGVPIGEEILKPPRFLISVEGLLEIFGYFLWY